MADAGGAAQDVEAGGAVFARGDAEFEPLVGVVDGEALERGFVEVVEYLADDAAVFDVDGIEFGAGDGVVDELGHVVLAGFEVEKGWLVIGVLEASFFAEQRPVKFERLAGQTGECGDAHGWSGGDVGGAQGLMVALGQGALRDDDENVVAAHAILLQQPLDALDGEGGFAATKGAGKVEFALGLDCVHWGEVYRRSGILRSVEWSNLSLPFPSPFDDPHLFCI